jgi:hypothetical protein
MRDSTSSPSKRLRSTRSFGYGSRAKKQCDASWPLHERDVILRLRLIQISLIILESSRYHHGVTLWAAGNRSTSVLDHRCYRPVHSADLT